MPSPLRIAALCAALAVVFTAAMLPAGRAEAHANQVRSLPAPDSELEEPPDRVIVWFSEPIEARLSEIRVLDAQGQQVDNGDSALSSTEPTAMLVTLPPLGNGTYTAVWSNASTVDGHRVVGSFRFAVGEPLASGPGLPAPTQPLLQTGADPFLRWAFFIGALTFVGVLAFDLFVVRSVLASENGAALSPDLVQRLQRMMLWLMLGALGLMVFGMLSLLVQQASVTFDRSVLSVIGEPISSVLDSDWGRQWLWRGLAVVASGALAVLAARSVLRSSGDAAAPGGGAADEAESNTGPGEDEYEAIPLAFTETIPGALALTGGVAVLALTTLSSHNAAAPADIRTPAVVSDFIHLLAAALWFGGLFYLAAGATVALRHLGPEQRSAILAALLPRFSSVAFASAGTLIATGIFAGYMQVTIPAATNTPYGWALVSKLSLLVPLFGLAAVNSFVISRAILSQSKGRHIMRSGMTSAFRRFVRWEAGVALLVLLAVGWLAGLEPARQYAARTGIGIPDEVTFSDFVEGAEINLSVVPGQTGQNTVTATLEDRRGDPITNATDVRVRLRYLQEDLGEALMSLHNNGNGVWTNNDFNISIGGAYQAEALVVRPDAFDARTSFRFEAATTGGTANNAIRPTRTVTWTLFGIEILAIGVVLVLAGAPVLRKLRAPSRMLSIPGALFSVAGIVLLLNAQVFRAGFPEDRFNPFPITEESIETGRTIFMQSCATCHGESGRGDGPQAPGLSPPPADLTVHVPLHTDGDLFRIIRDGIPGTAMPSHEVVLTEEQMWHLVNFLRTFER